MSASQRRGTGTWTWTAAVALFAGIGDGSPQRTNARADDADDARAVIEQLLAEHAARRKAEAAADEKANRTGSTGLRKTAAETPAEPAADEPEPKLTPIVPPAPAKAADGVRAPGPKPSAAPLDVKPPASIARPAVPNDPLAATADDVIDRLVNQQRERSSRDRRDGLLAYQQAQAQARAGRLAEAVRLAKQAKKLYPDNTEIAAYAASLATEASKNKLVTDWNAQAKARVAGAVDRANRLAGAGRSDEAQDLYVGVVLAVGLFPNGNGVDLYRRQAEEALCRLQGVAKPHLLKLQLRDPDGKTADVAAPPEAPALLVAPGAAAPNNLRRVLRGSEEAAPAWYVELKTKLSLPMTVDYRRLPATLVFDEIAKATGAPFVMDEAVTLSRSHLNAMIDLRVSQTAAETILDVVCAKAGVEYILMERG
ncbi:MAG: hypothetical protein ACRC1K_21805, partial [Planctomycetia bacterium]